jgi:NADH-quinone oxidoreductase subunit N
MANIIILFLTALAVLFAGLFKKRSWLVPLAAIGTAGCLAFTLLELGGVVPGGKVGDYADMVYFDRFALAFSVVVLTALLLLLGLVGFGFRQLEETLGDHLGLMLFSFCGALCMVAFENVVMLFIAIEIMSIPLYVLAGSRRHDLSSNEAALKYYLMGSFTTGFFLFGAALIYGATGSFDMDTIAANIAQGGHSPMLLNTGIVLMTIGLCFKVSAAPFHFWAPDVYQGSPTMVTAFMATVVKVAAIAAFYKFFSTALVGVSGFWEILIAAVAALTMTLANLTAIFQNNFKRLMAFSGISHAGYLLLGVVAADVPGSAGAVLFYAANYVLASVAAFAVFMLASGQKNEDGDIGVFNGLGKAQPFLAFILLISLLSMAGIPPLPGFFGKYFVFTAAFAKYPWLVLLAVANSVVSVVYYFKIVKAMYFNEGKLQEGNMEVPASYRLTLWAGAALMLGLIAVPGFVYHLIGQ